MKVAVVKRLRRWNWSEAARMVRECVMELAGEVVEGFVRVQEGRWGKRWERKVLAERGLKAA